MTSFFRTIFALIAVAFLFAPAAAHAQEGDTAVIGGPGGGQSVDRCPNGYLLVGMVYQGNKNINTVQALCRQFVEGRFTGYAIKLRTWGTRAEDTGSVFDPNVFPPKSAYCAAGTAVQAISVGVSAGNVNLVHDFAFKCRSPLNHQYNDSARSRIAGGDTDYTESADCGGGAIANGIVVRHGSLIDALGLHCLTYAPPAAAAQSAPAKPIKATGRAKTTSSKPAAATGPPLALRATISGPWKVTAGEERYNLMLSAAGNGFMPGQGDTLPFPVAGTLTGDDGSPDTTGTFSANMLATRQLQGGYGQKNGKGGQCMLNYAADGQSLVGDCSRGKESVRWTATRGTWPVGPSKRLDRAALRTVEVKLAVDVYAAPGGNGQPIAELGAGTTDVTLVEACQDNWCHVRWGNKEGWVYSGPDYNSLGQ